MSTSVPLPLWVRPKPVPLMAPPTVKVLLLTVKVRLAFIATAPVPRFRLLLVPFEPAKVKSPFQYWALLDVLTIAPPLVLSSVPPLMTRLPPEMAPALLKFNCPPLFKVVLPVMVSALFKVRTPPELTTKVPAPKLFAPFRINVPALTVVPPV